MGIGPHSCRSLSRDVTPPAYPVPRNASHPPMPNASPPTLPRTVHPTVPPVHVDGFDDLRPIGRGGFSYVFSARD